MVSVTLRVQGEGDQPPNDIEKNEPVSLREQTTRKAWCPRSEVKILYQRRGSDRCVKCSSLVKAEMRISFSSAADVRHYVPWECWRQKPTRSEFKSKWEKRRDSECRQQTTPTRFAAKRNREIRVYIAGEGSGLKPFKMEEITPFADRNGPWRWEIWW